jgi:dTDP-glucose 4,6-dehydratase
VTGGAGFIGSNFVRMFNAGLFPRIQELLIIDSLTYAGNLENIRNCLPSDKVSFFKGDIRNSEVVEPLVQQVDAVINFAAESHVDNSIEQPKLFVETNLLGFQVLLDAARKCPSIRFIQISTDEVYGTLEFGSWDENSPLAPRSPYSASKAAADLLGISYHKTFGTDFLITRASNNYGPYQFPEKLIPRFVTNLLEGQSVPVYGDGLNVRDWLHVDDHCMGIYLALTKGISGEVYNLGGGHSLSNLELTQLIIKKMGLSLARIEFVEDRPGHDFRYAINCEKAISELGYLPQVEFESGIDSVIEWYERNSDWWKALKSK